MSTGFARLAVPTAEPARARPTTASCATTSTAQKPIPPTPPRPISGVGAREPTSQITQQTQQPAPGVSQGVLHAQTQALARLV